MFVVASLWWWGVVFDLWIVVASILHARTRVGVVVVFRGGEDFCCCGLLCVVMCNFFFLYSGFLCCKCLRAHGGCLGIGSR